MTNFQILVYFDAVCAWCFVGQRALDQAISLYQRTYPGGKDDTFTFTYHPFYLRTNSPKDGVPLREAMTAKNGEDKSERIFSRVAQIGRNFGIAFNGNSRTGDTRLCHQMIYLTGQKLGSDVQKRLVENVYSMHFELGGDITSSAYLTGAAKSAGLDSGEVGEWLVDEEAATKVDDMAAAARESGVTSVPTFEIGGIRVEGAEDVQGMFEALVEAKSKSM